MKVANTIQQVKDNEVKISATDHSANNSANNNGSNNKSNSNAAFAQSKVVKTDTVELSKKSVELAVPTATQSEPKVEEATKKVTAAVKSQDQRADARKAMAENQEQLSNLVKGLSKLGMGSREVSSIIKNANREANKTIGIEIKQAYNDFRSHKINTQSFYNKLYGTAVKKLDGLVSALRDALAQKVAPTVTKVTNADYATKASVEENTEKTQETASVTVSKADGNGERADKSVDTGSGQAIKPPELKVNDAKAAYNGEEKEVEKAEKEEGDEKSKTVINANKGNGNGIGNGTGIGEGILGSGPGSINANEKADKAFAQIIDFFNGIDKMINRFVDKVEGKDSNDKGDSLVKFASRLNDMFSGVNRAFGSQSNEEEVGHRLGMAQVNKETISQLFDNGYGSGAINRIGDAGEGSGNFNAVSFMSSLSNSISDALDNYRDVQEATEEKADEESKGAFGILA